MSVEGLCFMADFRDELALEESLEVLRVGRFRLGEHVVVDQLVNWRAFHFGSGDVGE